MKRPKHNRIIRITRLIACCAITILIIFFVAHRISVVNAITLLEQTRFYSPGEAVPYPAAASQTEEGGKAATLTVLNSALLDYSDLAQVLPYYEDPFIEAGSATDAKFLIIDLLLSTNTSEIVPSPLPFLSVSEKAWGNGPDLRLLQRINPDLESLQLAPGEEVDVLVPFEAIDTQFGFNTSAWNSFGERGMQLVLSGFPEKTVIALGSLQDFDESSLVIQ